LKFGIGSMLDVSPNVIEWLEIGKAAVDVVHLKIPFEHSQKG